MSAFSVSVVIPLYNKAPFIRRTLESVFAQTHPADEIIIVDDQSSDEGPDIVRAMAFPNVRLITQSNAGPGPARNRGVAEANTPWVAFLDGDDLWFPNHLAALSRLRHEFPEASALAAEFKMRPAGALLDPVVAQKVPDDRLLDFFLESLSHEAMWTSCVAMQRSAFQSTGGFGAFQPGEDTDLWARFALDHAIAKTSEITAIYIKETGGLMDQLQTIKRRGYHLAPIFESLDMALDDIHYASSHSAIRKYKAKLMERNMRQALYRGEASVARRYADHLLQMREAVPLLLRILSWLPEGVLHFAMESRTRLRRRNH